MCCIKGKSGFILDAVNINVRNKIQSGNNTTTIQTKIHTICFYYRDVFDM